MTKTHPTPAPPGDDLFLWGAFWLVVGFMFTVIVTGCGGDEVEASVHVGVHPRDCPNGCEDYNLCTEDLCTLKGCIHDPTNGAACAEPGLPNGVCWDGECVCVDAAGCDDGEDCTVDACHAGWCEHDGVACAP